ncbi:ATP-binding protein [Cytobacillus sp.]|uniref:sensor histidine kinase n=1 Tax=Cytobacillus sp. TaxID=2675269 RepID=UPI0028BEBCE8|nr:ATP-binding protein [Cytobacillus sp.]
MKDKLLTYLLLIFAVSLGGELKFYPVEADIRVSLGTPMFFFFLLICKKINPISAGLSVGISVVFFRMLLLTLHGTGDIWGESFTHIFPVFFYYVGYGLFFQLFGLRKYYTQPLLIGLFGIVNEIIASIIEISFRVIFSNAPFTLSTFATISLIAFIRSFFVLGFINLFILREAKIAEGIQRKRNEEMLLLVSNLFVEMVQVKKSMKNAENITQSCYFLYRGLKKGGCQSHAKTALKIAGEVHEIKKDHQRIYAGLSKLKVKENLTDLMRLEEIIEVVVECNKKYAQKLGKTIEILVDIQGGHGQYHTFMVLSVINNLVTNSVEAIKDTGSIFILIERVHDNIKIQVSDNGPGIPLKCRNLIFQPGYTTKYDSSGKSSNGIGLSHVKEVIENLGGEIRLSTDKLLSNTTFIIQLPIRNINQSG